MKQTEREITSAIRSLLRSIGVVHYKNIGCLGMPRGVPDIVGLWGASGRFLGIEVKTETGKLSRDQKKWLDLINMAGGLAFVARSVDDVIYKLEIRDRFLF